MIAVTPLPKTKKKNDNKIKIKAIKKKKKTDALQLTYNLKYHPRTKHLNPTQGNVRKQVKTYFWQYSIAV